MVDFPGHPDDWSDEEFAAYISDRALRRAQTAETAALYTPTTEVVRRIYENHYITDEDRKLGSAEFDRWLSRVMTDAYFTGAEALADQNAEDRFDGSNVPEFDSLYEEGVSYKDWQARNGR